MAKFPLNKYSTKEEIYRTVNYLKCSLKLNSYPLNSKKILQRFCKNLTIECLPFVTSDICRSYCKCVCSEKNIISQESSIEYQANEGAAQCLVPYERFIPEISNLYDDAMSSDEIDFFIAKLAQKYHVTSAVISVRLQSLKYEIWQYMSGTAIKHLRILSDRHQKQEGIEVESIIDKRNKKRIEENQNYRIYIRQCNA